MIEKNKIDDVFYLYKFISEQTCPICNKNSPITVVKVRFVVGVIFISHRETYYKVGCKKCLRLQLLKSTIITFLFGWWSIIPLGFIHTIYTIIVNLKKLILLQNLNSDFLKFIYTNQVKLENIISQESELNEFLKNTKHKIVI